MYIKCDTRDNIHDTTTYAGYHDISFSIDSETVVADVWRYDGIKDIGYADVPIQRLLDAKSVEYKKTAYPGGNSYFKGSGRHFIKWWISLNDDEYQTDSMSRLWKDLRTCIHDIISTNNGIFINQTKVKKLNVDYIVNASNTWEKEFYTKDFLWFFSHNQPGPKKPQNLLMAEKNYNNFKNVEIKAFTPNGKVRVRFDEVDLVFTKGKATWGLTRKEIWV